MPADPVLNLNPDFPDELFQFNRLLDAAAGTFRVDETFLIGKISELDRLNPVDESGYWLTLARLTELAVTSAGAWVDLGELKPAGDLLINPRRVLVHVRNESSPRVKQRHVRLTEQFSAMGEGRADVIDWLKRETVVEVNQKALLPELVGQLTGSGFLRDEYLEGLDLRLKKMAGAIGLVSAALGPPHHDLHRYLSSLPAGDRDYFEANLCRFDLGLYNELGRDLMDLLLIPGYESRFLA